MEKALAMGKELGLTDEKLAEFVEKNESKFAADMEREERRVDREMKQKQLELEMQYKKEVEQQRLKHELELEQIKLEALRIEGSQKSFESTPIEASAKPRPKIPFFDEATDDMDSYLERFEWIAENYNWDKEDWPFHLSQYLRGKATEAYTRLSRSDRKNYDIVKEALLRRYNLTDEGYRKKFRESQPDDGETPQQFLVRLKNYLEKWIQLSDGKNAMDLFLIEQFISACPTDVAAYLKQSKIESPEAVAEDADRYLAAHGKKLTSRMTNTKKQNGKPTDGPKCLLCNGAHMARDCSQNKTGKFCVRCRSMTHNTADCKSTDKSQGIIGQKAAALLECAENNGDDDGRSVLQFNGKKYIEIGFCKTVSPARGENVIVDGYINRDPAKVLRDTGCNTVLVASKFVRPDQFTGESGYCLLADGTARKMDLASIDIDTPYYKGTVVAMVSDNPIHDLLLGNIPGVRSPDNADASWNQCNVLTRAQTKAKQTPMRSLKVNDIEGFSVDRDKLTALQKADESIKRLYSATDSKIKGEQTTRFYIDKNILYREYVNPKINLGQPVVQVVVPTPLRAQVMQLAHCSIMGGHLGTQKTMDRIISDFFWPGMNGDITRFCQSCDICQKTVKKGATKKVPLQKTPIIDTPFKRCAVDLIGPIHPASEKGHRYILTLVDYATRYPEAVPLKEISSEVVAEAMLDIYSRVGIPEEVISDQGTQFISEYMKEFSRLMGLKQLPTTPYHAMANGLVERFNGTLKSMLKKLCATEPRQWHRFINPALFAYREVPQESTGFSPFELLYGRTVRGPMTVLKQMWTQQDAEDEVKSSYQYMFDLRKRLEDVMELATKNLQTNQARYKAYFDKSAKVREFNNDDKVLILLPTDSNKLLMQWKGPYKILEKLGFNNYSIEINGKVKTYHANMLKKYHTRMTAEVPELKVGIAELVECASVGMVVEDAEDGKEHSTLPQLQATSSGESIKDIKIGRELEKSQVSELTTLLQDYENIFSDKPGNSKVLEHKITLTTEKPIFSRAYKLPYATRESLKKDIEDMVEMGVIRKSTSPYASPIVLVKKPDGSNRLSVDYRKLNKITIFDPEPMTTAEDLFQKLTNDRYFSKLDLSKGYWQIPVAEQDIEKTAFVTPDGHFEFLKMPFGMINSAATLVRAMRHVFQGLENVDNYIDDIIIHTKTWKEHLEVLKEVLVRLEKAGFSIRPTKCQLGELNIEFIGQNIKQGVLQPLDDNVKRILDAPRPTTKTQVRSFNGLAGYYRDFIPNYSAIAAPLTDLTKKGQPNHVNWGPAQQKAFDTLKRMITEKPILRIPDISRPFVLRTDASNIGLGAVLLQPYDGQYFPVSYASRKLLDREKNYSAIEKEGLALVWAVEKFRQYLYGIEFTLQTDHRPLVYINSAKFENSRVMRWALMLQNYRIHMESIKGSDNFGADYMSRVESVFE